MLTACPLGAAPYVQLQLGGAHAAFCEMPAEQISDWLEEGFKDAKKMEKEMAAQGITKVFA